MKNYDYFIWGYALKNSLAHEGIPNAESVISGLFNEGLKKNDVQKIMPKIKEVIDEIKANDISWQEVKFKEYESKLSEREGREGLPELPNNKKVIMRFAPSASGPLHVGHAMTASISFLYTKKYRGKFYVRIEDTNPENIYPLSYKMIESDSKWLFEDKAEIIIQSYRMETYYKYTKKIIKKRFAYVCTCSQEEFEKYVIEKKDCPCRNLTVRENSERWIRMLDKSSKGFKQGDAVLRFKSFEGMASKNPAMRDFPLARINTAKHFLQGKKYRVWPLMNLAVIVDDIEMKITHIIRAKDHRDNAKKQEMIFKVLGKKLPWTAFLGKFKFKDMELSTTKMKQEIEKGKFSGWDDQRLPTLASLKKQGYKPSAFWKFAEQIGLSESDKVIDKKEYFMLLDSFNM